MPHDPASSARSTCFATSATRTPGRSTGTSRFSPSADSQATLDPTCTIGERQGYIWGGGPDGNRWSFGPDADFDLDIAADRLSVIGHRLTDVHAVMPEAFTYGFGVTSVAGVEFIDLNPELGEYFGSDTGVLVVEVGEDSTLGLMAGDVVLAVGAREADTVGRVLRLIRSYDEDEPIQFRIIRRGSELTAEGFLQ